MSKNKKDKDSGSSRDHIFDHTAGQTGEAGEQIISTEYSELMQKAYEGLVDNLSRRIEEAAVDESGEGEDANCGRCEDCKAK